LQKCLEHIFSGSNLSRYKASDAVELECIMALIPGGEYMGMLPYSRATVIDQKAEADPGKKKGSTKYAQVIGFASKRWLSQRELSWPAEERRVFHTLNDSSQKVLAMQYEDSNLGDCKLALLEPQNLQLCASLPILEQRPGVKSQEEDEKESPSEKPQRFVLTS
jgi:hypothetical protein